MPEVKWIKITTDMFDDEKIRLLEAMPDADTLLVIWVKLICQAGKVNAEGYIYLSENMPYTEEQLATVFNRPVNTVKLALRAFEQLGMVRIEGDGSIHLPNFSKHQNVEGLEKIRENTRLRVAKYRQLKAGNEKVTDGNVTVTQQNKKRIDKKKSKKESKSILPDFIDKELWDDFLEMRRVKKVVTTEKAMALLIKELEKLKDDGNDPNSVLKQSVMRSYTGVFPLNNKGGRKKVAGIDPDKFTQGKYGYVVNR